jgi:hypothetical protein
MNFLTNSVADAQGLRGKPEETKTSTVGRRYLKADGDTAK